METSMYYTYSTIAQVLAAFIALSGVFVIFKIQELKKIQLFHVNRFITTLEGMVNQKYQNRKLKNYYNLEYIEGMKEEMENSIFEIKTELSKFPKHKIFYDKLNQLNFSFTRIESKRRYLIRLTKISLVTGVLAMISSMLILPNVNDIFNNPTLRIELIVIVLLLAILSIIFMTYIIFISLSAKNEKIDIENNQEME